jgi:hypothetical protein
LIFFLFRLPLSQRSSFFLSFFLSFFNTVFLSFFKIEGGEERGGKQDFEENSFLEYIKAAVHLALCIVEFI